jgi:tRNA threonylcarbamoyladenosine biosynthesis protein TsaB
MIILGFDTSSAEYSTVGVLNRKGELFVLPAPDGERGGSSEERLMDTVRTVIESAGLTIGEIDLIGAGIGPGSFTGIRIGVSAARSLAWASGKPLIGVSSLELLARSVREKGAVCAVTDARMKRVFAAVFRGGVRIMDDSDIEPERLADKLAGLPDKEIFIAGDGLARYRDIFADIKEKTITLDPGARIGAEVICLRAAEMFRGGNTGDYKKAEPVYLRKSEAEIQLLAKNKQ